MRAGGAFATAGVVLAFGGVRIVVPYLSRLVPPGRWRVVGRSRLQAGRWPMRSRCHYTYAAFC